MTSRKEVASLIQITDFTDFQMAYYTDITELPPLPWPGTTGGLIFRWSDSYTGKLYQLYIDGRLVAETNVVSKVAGTVKQLPYTVSSETVTWEVIAIDPADAVTDYSASLTYSNSVGPRVQLVWARDQAILELGGYANVYGDLGTGTVDETSPLNAEPIYNFPDGWGMYGFGMGPFGEGPLGVDGNGMGFGVGEFTTGLFGFDLDNITWTSEPFPPGVYLFSVRLHDAAGNPDDDSLGDISVVVDCYPPAPAAISMSSYNSGTDIVTLSVTVGTAQMPYE